MHMTVERVSYLHEREIDELMNRIKHSYRPDVHTEAQIIRKAVSFVRKGARFAYRFAKDESSVETVCTDGVDHLVKLTFSEVDATCTCEEPGWCPHKIAVVFHLYSQFHSLTDWLHEWQQTEVTQMTLKLSERSPEAWNVVLRQLTNPLRNMDPRENANVFIHETSLMDQKVIPLAPFEWEWKPLFDLFYRLHVVDAAWSYVQVHLDDSNQFTYREWQLQMWLGEQIGKIKDHAQSLRKKLRLFETDVFYDALKIMIQSITLYNKGLFEKRLELFRVMWDLLYTDQASQKKELARLLEEDSAEAPFFAAYVYLEWIDDVALEKVAAQTGGKRVTHWLPLADHALDMGQTESLAIIMESIYPYIGTYYELLKTNGDKHHFIRKMDELLEEAHFPEIRREELFMLYGKDGVSAFGDFLIERERFDEWAALMHRFNVPYDGVDPDTLKFVLANDPASVMPLLHTYAMQFIQEKNRHSYRRAVRLFKNMKTGAKKSGKIEFWNRYIDTVREQYKRLRALSEEMEKGNLNL
ncbi:hypothetical protein [Sporosarcina sp. OR05]|uniref:hypothetical protein n=1 Tax=Sporosarcina sp. OR05 TaxID=2969819 RepID=UPI00352A16FE